MTTRSYLIAAAIFMGSAVLIVSASDIARAAAPGLTPLPRVIASLHAFRGTISYVATRDGDPRARAIDGSVSIGRGRYAFVESDGVSALRADELGATFALDGASSSLDDPLAADPLANAWAYTVARIAAEPVAPVREDQGWTATGVRLFVDPSGSVFTGIVDERSSGDVGYTFADWTTVQGIDVPSHILRLRSGRPDASFTIIDYAIQAAAPEPASGAAAMAGASASDRTGVAPAFAASGASPGLPLAEELGALGAIVALCGFALLWARREALIRTVCRRMAEDPRGWRRAGVSIFVGPDGALLMDRMTYRVGPHFYNRAALVQTSLLFIRVSAPGAPRCVILPRRFRPVDLGIRPHRQTRPSAGLTLIETIVATALFSAVILLGVYPALLALSRADALAQERSLAAVIASNALSDEETAAAYDGGAPAGTVDTAIDGLDLRVTVTPGGLRATSDVDIAVIDPRGDEVAHLRSLLGPPVPAPPKSRGGPPDGG